MMRLWFVLAVMGTMSCATSSGARRTTTHQDAVQMRSWADAMYAPFDASAYAELSQAPIDPERLEPGLLSAAIWRETNAIRQAHGLKALGYCAPCRLAAQRYSEDMVKRDFFRADHGHPDAELATPRLRMEAALLRGASGWGENIAASFALKYKSGAPYYEPEKAGQPFLDEHQKPLLPHSYESFAKAVVEQWMNSPHHRANILDRDWSHFGAACTAYREKNGFPKLNCTQDFTRLDEKAPPAPARGRVDRT